MSAAVRSRTAARGWVTRAGNAIRDLFNQPVDYFALQTACDEFDMRLNALDNAQSMVELEIAEDLLDGDIEAAANFRNTSREPRLMAARFLHNQQLQDGSVDGGASVRDSVAVVSAKLPKIQLPHRARHLFFPQLGSRTTIKQYGLVRNRNLLGHDDNILPFR